ncbi:hypothetical protein HD806DRAFT_552804 [Xylariaceae sp. AK1471]|nr:hypothetical protein HD806DRAFT_552804 [Xylariaceae sp. AK1471]
MTSPSGVFRCVVEEFLNGDAIFIQHVPSDANLYKPQTLIIRFKRTIRVPDNSDKAKLPPGLGTFPLLKVHDFASKLPPNMAAKGGVFFPMYQREAMWIEFTANSPFMIKIYAGGVNVVSGEHNAETLETKMRRLDLISQDKSIQDYVVAPLQTWLDGFAVSPGVVRQFVAMPLGEGYSVEAQLTGQEAVGGLQFEITPCLPTKRPYQEPVNEYLHRPYPDKPCTPSGNFSINVKTLCGGTIVIPCSYYDQVGSVKLYIQDTQGVPPDQQLLKFNLKLLADRGILGADYGIQNGSTLYMLLRLRGGQAREPMGIAAGGKINQTIEKDTDDPKIWATSSTITIPVHVLTSAAFRGVTGREPPPCPISASTYAAAGLPFFNLPEKPTTISGDFDAVKSVNEIDQDRGLAQGSESSINPRVVQLNERGSTTGPTNHVDLSTLEDPDYLINPDGPLREVRTLNDMLKELEDLSLRDEEGSESSHQ